MSRLVMKVSIVSALVVSVLAGPSSSLASTWHTNGNATGITFSATGGARQLSVHTSAGVQGITCSGGTITGRLYGSASSGAGLATIYGPTTHNCLVVGQAMAVKCGVGALDAVSYSAATNLVSGVGNVTGVACVAAKINGACGNATTFTGGGITFSGSGSGTYGNTTQQVTVNTAGQNISVAWSSTGCLQGTGTGSAKGTLRNASGTSLVYTATSTFRPQISFTP
jgi:hypothetical protein